MNFYIPLLFTSIMDIYNVYTKKRSEFGRQVFFTDRPAQIIADIQPNIRLSRNYIQRNPVERGTQSVREFAEHWVNTSHFETENRGINHVEGGWPREVDPFDHNQTTRFLRKIEKDEAFRLVMLSLGKSIEHTIKKNNTVDIYENYFQHLESSTVEEIPYVRTINTFRDPNNTQRTANHISWNGDGGRKLAVSYCNLEFQSSAKVLSEDSYIWDIEKSAKPDLILKPISPLVSIEYNPKDKNQLVAGCYNGQVCIFDTRKGCTAVEQSLIESSHRDPVYKTIWLHSKTETEFFSASTDGKILWWDMRKLSEPVETLILDVIGKDRIEHTYGAMCLEYEPTMPMKFMVGTEQGSILSCHRKGKSDADKIGNIFPGHWGPVYALQRHPHLLKNFLSVGDWTVRIWSEEMRDDSIISTKPSMHVLTDGQWSPVRSSIFFTTKMNGTLDVWDILHKQNEPILSARVIDEPLHCLRVQEPHGRLVACGSQNGTVTLLQLSDSLCTQGKHEKALINGMFERETRRTKILEVRMRRDIRQKSAHIEMPSQTDPSKFKDNDSIEKAERIFWEMISEDKRKQYPSTTDETSAANPVTPMVE